MPADETACFTSYHKHTLRKITSLLLHSWVYCISQTWICGRVVCTTGVIFLQYTVLSLYFRLWIIQFHSILGSPVSSVHTGPIRVCRFAHKGPFPGNFSTERQFCKMWLANKNVPSEKNFEVVSTFNNDIFVTFSVRGDFSWVEMGLKVTSHDERAF